MGVPKTTLTRTMSTFAIYCARCGQQHAVSSTQAGATLACACGHTQIVPTLGELRRQAGLVVYEKSPAEAILELIGEGRLPADTSCLRCGMPRAARRTIVAVCERSRVRTYHSRSVGEGGLSALGGLHMVMSLAHGNPFSLLFHVVQSDAKSTGDGVAEQLGRNLSVPLPAHFCPDCWPRLRGYPLLPVFQLAMWWSLLGAGLLVLLWLAAPYTGWTFSFWWAWYVLAVVPVWWWARNRCTAKAAERLKAVLRKVPDYAELFDDYPEAELAAGETIFDCLFPARMAEPEHG